MQKIKNKAVQFINAIKSKPAVAIASSAAAVVVVLVICFALLGGYEPLPESFAGEISIVPVYDSEYGVGAAQGFIITSAEPLTDELVVSSLVLSPPFEYTLKREDEGKSYTIKPKTPLLANTVYQMGLDPERALADRAPRASNTWAFQIEAEFELLGSIPTDKGTDVPVNTVLRFTFTQAVDAQIAGGYINVSPEIGGIWESKGEQLTFIPQSDLSLNTVYTISVREGLPNLAGDGKLSESREIQFQTALREDSSNRTWFNIENDNNCFRTDEIPAFRYYNGWNGDTIGAFNVEVFSFSDESSYIEALKSRQPAYYWCYAETEEAVDTGSLTEVYSFEVKNLEAKVLRCPETLSAGYYLADIKADGERRQSLFQVTDISGYFAAGEKDSLVWINDLATGQPISGATVSLVGSAKSAVTDDMGIAVIDGTNERNPIISISGRGDRLVMNSFNYYAGQEEPAINSYDYWYCVSTDRQIYRPGDTVNYFGIMAPRSEKGRHFAEAELVLRGGAYWRDSAIRQKVEIEDGVISGSWELPMLNTGWYSVSIEIDGQSFGYAGFEVAYYEKPAYQFSLKSGKKAVFAGEQVTWSIHAGYFEGTPVAGLEINTRHDGKEEKTTTDGEGETLVTGTARQTDSSYLTGSTYLSVSAVMPELGDVSAYSDVAVFNSDIDIEGKVKRDGGSFKLHLDGYDVNLDKINEGAQIWRSEYREPISGAVSLSADLVRIEYDKIQNGPFYNEYTLQTYYTYDYNQREVHENSFELSLMWGGLDFTADLETGNSYRLVIFGKDHKGRDFTRSYYIPEESRNATIPNISGGEDFWENFEWGQYRYFYISETNSGNYEHAVGDELAFAIWCWGVQVPKPERGNILYFRSQETVRDYVLSRDGTYEMKFEETDIPNINLAAVCFDGKYYAESECRYVSLNPADKAAKVSVTTDKKRYAPGETVEMSLSMTDKDGKPLAGSINVSIVDEALFAVAENYVDIGNAVFGNKYYYSYRGAVSHLPVEASPGGAEMGDGGGEREDFRDTAFFKTIKADSKGRASLSFELPDNITSWRVTWQAYSPGIHVGKGSINIDASLDFFLDYRLARTFLKGDEPKAGLRSAGLGIDPLKSLSSYTVEITQAGFSKTASGQANTWQEISLPQLTEDKIRVKISAQNGEYKDAVNMDISTVDSFASHWFCEESKLAAGLRPAGSKTYPTTIVFSDKAYAAELSSLYNLAWRSGIRLEQKLVSQIASDILFHDMGVERYSVSEDEERTAREDIIKYQRGNGGVSSFTYSDADVETSALAASIGGEYFDKDALAAYFYNSLGREDAGLLDKTLCLWGLAALRAPVLLDITKTLEDPYLDGECKLNLTMALYFAGDGARAKTLAKEVIAEFTEDLGTEVRSKIGISDQLYGRIRHEAAEQTKATARLALLASAFDLPQAEGLAQYMSNNAYEGDYYLMEKMGIAQNNLSRLPEGDTKFAYALEGKSNTVDLRKKTVYSLLVLPEQLDRISFSEIEGDITVLSCYLKEGQPPDGEAAAGQLTIDRAINGSRGGAVSVPQGKPVRITIDFWIAADAPNGCYTITDMLPAGLRFGNNETSSDCYAWPGGNENKEVTAGIYKTDYSFYSWWKPSYYMPDGSLKGKLVYTAYPAMTGSFTAEAPRFGHSINDGIMIHAPETRVTIE
ncbi:MAG: Ig-like domain-containing protein [Clostridiales bacterium]|nr:Ig-like domain-containing protein [Clostridiales bacterium]